MFCKICGYELQSNAKICPRCGSDVETSEFVDSNSYTASAPAAYPKTSGRAITGFVLSLAGLCFLSIVCGVLGIIFSVLGRKDVISKSMKGKGFAVAGLVISIVAIAVTLLYYFFAILIAYFTILAYL